MQSLGSSHALAAGHHLVTTEQNRTEQNRSDCVTVCPVYWNCASASARVCEYARCGAVRCGAVRCGAVRCGAVRCGAVHAEYTKQRQQRPYSQRKGLIYCESLSFHFSVSLCLIVCCIWFWIWICMDTCWPGFLKARQAGASCTNNCFCLSFIQTFHVAIELNTFAQSPPCRSCTALPDANLRCFFFSFISFVFVFCFLFSRAHCNALCPCPFRLPCLASD